MSRKRFVKLLISCGIERNRARQFAEIKPYCPNCGAKMDEPVGNSDRLEENKE